MPMFDDVADVRPDMSPPGAAAHLVNKSGHRSTVPHVLFEAAAGQQDPRDVVGP